ncbi:hypothetical protein CFN78_09330 [Amycolatopsis antarctica]|uniref:LppX_LprAFG lipoprotein n=1 Tax=Amycolatopsis antarctica TaxID=1854586 RepID=A0A263D5C3_9PSEU|nr:hypothetical protein [Amycolatopsis antarctica]OZM73704.1 hypothetical protein CFN78_09330 [Amycolatopsis antarctica]
MRKTAIAAGGFALVLALSACGGGDNGTDQASPAIGGGSALFGNAQELVQAAESKTQNSKSSKFSMDMSMAGMTIAAKGEGRYDGENSAMSMTMDMMGQQIEMRFVDRAMYMKMPQGMGGTADKPWIKISADGTDPMSQQMGGQFDQLTEQSDPTKMLEYIKQAGTITNSETTQLDGQETTHYSIDLDFDKMIDLAPGGLEKEQAEQMRGKIGVIPMELWLNSEQLPVQITMDMGAITKAAMEAAGAPAGGAPTEGKMTMKYSDWGAEVDVAAPPADQVGEMPNMGGLGG